MCFNWCLIYFAFHHCIRYCSSIINFIQYYDVSIVSYPSNSSFSSTATPPLHPVYLSHTCLSPKVYNHIIEFSPNICSYKLLYLNYTQIFINNKHSSLLRNLSWEANYIIIILFDLQTILSCFAQNYLTIAIMKIHFIS